MSWCISPRFAMFGNLRWTFMLLHIYTNKFRVHGVKVASVLFSISIFTFDLSQANISALQRCTINM